MLGFFKSKREKRVKKVLNDCGCVCFCKSCNDILNDQAKCVEESGIVIYTCSCGAVTKFNFDIAPVPIMVD